ncbi:hypothetical protein JRI60_40295 [Archangium violaceum]|uniref:hypothetical protein n=1 Tax=Archangium violaceum TaxID=83451 RepID=UPI001951033A|nr:hypothetical protein [Archangium violaceum]QRN95261.1 hypothetical protein JRI60_40295 [Archangium violaceum]
MTKRISTAVAVLGAAGMISGCNLEQPSAGCIVQDATDWTAKYTLKDQAQATTSCGKLTGEQLGVFKYINPNATAEQKAQSMGSKLAIRPNGQASLTTFVYPIQDSNDDDTAAFYPNGKPVLTTHEESRLQGTATPADATNMSGTFTEQPDDESMCTANGFTETRVAAKEIVFTPPHGFGDEVRVPAQTAEYLFKDVQVYSDPSAPGTQLRGTLVYGDGTGCKAEYEVWALWPTVACETDADCGEGSGLNPDFDVKCDTTLNNVVVVDEEDYGRTKIYAAGVCAPARRPPSFKPTKS